MSLNEYDTVSTKIDRKKSWIDIKNKIIYSREIKIKRRYYNYLSKYDNVLTGETKYYLSLTDDVSNNKVYNTVKDNYGRFKFKCNDVFEALGFTQISSDRNITLRHYESGENYDIYEIVC